MTPELAEAFRAFLLADREYFVRALQLQPWQDSPLVCRPDRCTQGHPIAGPESWTVYGCSDQHEAYALRKLLMAEIEARAGLAFEALSAEDDEVAGLAWSRLDDFAKALGITDEAWQQTYEGEEQ